ncbi:Trafficking protein particle complex subunit 12 [Portunus trituberculatus]|uniref:Trafficking protein particle complex subunit 12 n=1 Tax=Portunus trituberculatus TaxID=210409 RepID=A0A5B7FR36_PORTR|nr:Trafficking protein particle complex subunit 12 [Portunus trituberculatus]
MKQGDPVKNLVRTYLGEEMSSKRVVLTAASVTQDDRGLRQLIAAGCYHAAVNLTTQLLTVYGQGEGRAGHPSKHTAHSIQKQITSARRELSHEIRFADPHHQTLTRTASADMRLCDFASAGHIMDFFYLLNQS